MSAATRRINVLALVFVAGLCAVVLHLLVIMVEQREEWLVRSYRNRWTFRDVPAQRGALRDRFGRVLAEDRPSFELQGHYREFRRHHAVGAAVHGANLLSAQRYGEGSEPYRYLPSRSGPHEAYAELVAMKVQLLAPGVLPNEARRDLTFYVTSVLSACSGRSWRKVYSALRQAHEEGRGPTVLQALDLDDPTQLTATFDAIVRELSVLDADLVALGHDKGLFGVLKEWRDHWREDRKTEGDRQREEIARVIATTLPFDVAAALAVGSDRHPGLLLRPSLVRRRTELPGEPSLPMLLGGVAALSRDDARDKRILQERVARSLDEATLAELVPDDAVPLAEFRAELRRRAESHLERALRSRGRTGSSGIERGQDDVLSGRPGLRLVERDKRAREQLLWSRMQVERGADVALTLDLDLQTVLEDEVAETYAHWHAPADAPVRERVEVALAVIDARTGDVLAVGGQPLRGAAGLRPSPAGLSWLGNGALGSVVKPFLLLEQMDAEADGRPCRPDVGFERCKLRWPFGSTTLSCTGTHGPGGIEALAQSCNGYFFQVATGIGADGVRRAMQRVGLWPIAMDQRGVWQEYPIGVRWSPPPGPPPGTRTMLQRLAIGYGLEGSVVHVARAYAAVATGRLPELSLVLDREQKSVALDVTEHDLELVRRGLRECVVSGTAAGVRSPGGLSLADLGVSGKTGTAEILRKHGDNNAWFAGYLPGLDPDAPRLAFAGVVYYAPEGEHGADAAGPMIARLLETIDDNDVLRRRYMSWRERR